MNIKRNEIQLICVYIYICTYNIFHNDRETIFLRRGVGGEKNYVIDNQWLESGYQRGRV